MSLTDPNAILRELLAGAKTPVETAHAILALPRTAWQGLALDSPDLSPSEVEQLEHLMPAVRWEMLKLTNSGRLPDVAYDSPEYHAFMATVRTIPPDSAGPAG
jgi:hypothetical protein